MERCGNLGNLHARIEGQPNIFHCHGGMTACTLEPSSLKLMDGSPVQMCGSECPRFSELKTVERFIPRAAAALPEKKIGRSHLIYHIWPRNSSETVWRWNVAQLLRSIEQFDGVRTIGIATSGDAASVEEVKSAFAGHRIDNWIVAENKSDVGEGMTFVEMLRTLPLTGRTFYAHAKGVRHGENPQVKRWAEMQYVTLLEKTHLVTNALVDHSMAGCFKQHFDQAHDKKTCDFGPCDWQYSGTFFWFRNADVLSNPNAFRRIESYWGIEFWPGQVLEDARGACLLGDRCGYLYDQREIDRWEPDFAKIQGSILDARSDKTSLHSYGDFYAEHLERFRFKPVRLLELGVQTGDSMHVWNGFFPHAEAQIVGMEIRELPSGMPKRVKLVKGDCCDPVIAQTFGQLDIVIDDASHKVLDQAKSLHLYWPKLANGGLYVIEDIQGDEDVVTLRELFPFLNFADLRSEKGRYDDRLMWAVKDSSVAQLGPARKKFCYFTGTTRSSDEPMIANMIESARTVGVPDDFHVFSAGGVYGAINHDLSPSTDWKNHMAKIDLLLRLKEETDGQGYEYFVWIDADHRFVRDPGDLSELLRDEPCWISMEGDLMRSVHQNWWSIPFDTPIDASPDAPRTGPIVELMRKMIGNKRPKLWNTNGGLWIVHRDAVEEFAQRTYESFEAMKAAGYGPRLINGKFDAGISDEPPLAVAGQTMVKRPELNVFAEHAHLWACDWAAIHSDANGRLPDGTTWPYKDYTTLQILGDVSPAIVHVMKGKQILAGRRPASQRAPMQEVPISAQQPYHREPVGTMLAMILKECGLEGTPDCACNQWANNMDSWGVAGCIIHRDEILAHLRGQAANAGWMDRLRVAARWYLSIDSLLDEAMKRASKTAA